MHIGMRIWYLNWVLLKICPFCLSSLLRSASSGYEAGYFFHLFIACTKHSTFHSCICFPCAHLSPLWGKFELQYTSYVFPTICFHRGNIDLSNLKGLIQMHFYLSESFVRKFFKKAIVVR